MTAERHGVAAKVIATVDDLDRIAADDEADVPALARLAARAVRREGARAQAGPALARDRERPRGGGGARVIPSPRNVRLAMIVATCDPRRQPMSPFLRNQWYTAATSAELGEKPLARTICNEPLVMFRGQDGRGRRAHRPLPAPQGAAVVRRSGRRRHPMRLSRHPLRCRRRLHPCAGQCADRPQFPCPQLPGARDARAHLRLARRRIARRSGADPGLQREREGRAGPACTGRSTSRPTISF